MTAKVEQEISRIYSIRSKKKVSIRVRYIIDCEAIIHAGYYAIYISSYPHSCQESPPGRGQRELMDISSWEDDMNMAGGIQRVVNQRWNRATGRARPQYSHFIIADDEDRNDLRVRKNYRFDESPPRLVPIVFANTSRLEIMN